MAVASGGSLCEGEREQSPRARITVSMTTCLHSSQLTRVSRGPSDLCNDLIIYAGPLLSKILPLSNVTTLRTKVPVHEPFGDASDHVQITAIAWDGRDENIDTAGVGAKHCFVCCLHLIK